MTTLRFHTVGYRRHGFEGDYLTYAPYDGPCQRFNSIEWPLFVTSGPQSMQYFMQPKVRVT